MSYEDVIAILGPPTGEIAGVQVGAANASAFVWRAGLVGHAHLAFQNGILSSKTQFGL